MLGPIVALGDVPNRFRGLWNGIAVVPVAGLLGQHKEVFVGARWTVTNPLRHRRALGPDHLAAKEPAVANKRINQPPRKPHEGLVLERGIGEPARDGCARCAVRITTLRETLRGAPIGVVGVEHITQVDPANAIVSKHAMHLREDTAKGFDVLAGGALSPDLVTVAIRTEAPIGRRGDVTTA